MSSSLNDTVRQQVFQSSLGRCYHCGVQLVYTHHAEGEEGAWQVLNLGHKNDDDKDDDDEEQDEYKEVDVSSMRAACLSCHGYCNLSIGEIRQKSVEDAQK